MPTTRLATAVALAGATLVIGFGGAAADAAVLGRAPRATPPTGSTTNPTAITPTKLDATSDRAALIRYRAYLKSLIAGEDLGRQSAIRFAIGVKLRCSGVLTTVAALPSAQVDQLALSDLGEEIGGDLALEFLSEAAGPFAQLSSQLGALSWSEPAPAQAVDDLLAAERDMLALSPTLLCANARTLANRPLSAPARTLAFVGTYLRASAVLRERLASFLSVLSTYSTPDEAPLIASIDRLVERFGSTSAIVEKAGAATILSALGLTGQ